MSQVTIYLDPETARKVREAAAGEGVSRSRWVAKLIERELVSSWPAAVRELAGAWPDFPSAAELRRSAAEDLPREGL